MKKIFSLIIILTFLSCKKSSQEEHYSFSGFGKLKIGSPIENLNQEMNLETTEDEVVPNEQCYRSESYKLSDSIGIVKNIFIRTYNKNIYHVAFDSDSTTNRLELSRLIFTDSLVPIGEFKNLEFHSKDHKVDLSVQTSMEKNTYIYTNVQIWKIVKMKKDSIYNSKFNMNNKR
jgi:hypothetical protein